MTTPNIDELIDRLYDWHNTSAEQNRLDMQKADDLLQSQAERIAELEAKLKAADDIDTLLCKEIDTLRAQLAEIAATEPVGYAVPTFNFDNSVIKPVHYAGTVPLFTRPMPADVTELVEALEKLASLGNGDQYGNSDGNMIARDALAKFKGAK